MGSTAAANMKTAVLLWNLAAGLARDVAAALLGHLAADLPVDGHVPAVAARHRVAGGLQAELVTSRLGDLGLNSPGDALAHLPGNVVAHLLGHLSAVLGGNVLALLGGDVLALLLLDGGALLLVVCLAVLLGAVRAVHRGALLGRHLLAIGLRDGGAGAGGGGAALLVEHGLTLLVVLRAALLIKLGPTLLVVFYGTDGLGRVLAESFWHLVALILRLKPALLLDVGHSVAFFLVVSSALPLLHGVTLLLGAGAALPLGDGAALLHLLDVRDA